jgi:outer membrane protein OmpA-like peptidoglycan-associated protein
MKQTLFSLKLLSRKPLSIASTSILAAFLSHAAVAQPIVGPYVSLGAGVDQLFNQTIPQAPAFGDGKKTITFGPGTAGQASVGYGIGHGIRVEIEGDYFNNHVKNLGVKPGEPLSAVSGLEQQFGGMANVFYDFDLGLPLYPYLGAGVGGQTLELNNVSFHPPGYTGSLPNRTTYVGEFAYQAIAGIAVPLSYVPGLSVTAEYRFMGLLNPPEAVPYGLLTNNGRIVAEGGQKFENVWHNTAMVGLRYSFNAGPRPLPYRVVEGAPAPAPARTYLVFFDWDRSDLTDRARGIIAEAAQASTRVQLTQIAVNGYTDLSGSPAYNERLSVRRAQAVAAELVRDGVAREAINIHGFGETNPLVATAKGVREPENRRVEIILK